jgi:hypothetical protein
MYSSQISIVHKHLGKGKDMAKKSKNAPKEVLLVASKVKEQIKVAGCNTAGDAIEGLNAWVHLLVEQATARAKANGRKTVRGHDFMA